MADTVLIVDDEELILRAYHRSLRQQFRLDVAMGGPQALQALEEHGPFAVLVADQHMPGMTGLDLLQEAARIAPDTTRIMLTGDSDQKTAVDAVNHGRVFRFLTKPCRAEDLAEAIRAGIRQHQLAVAEREILEQTLTGSLQVLTDLLSTVDPEALGRGRLLRERAAGLGRALGYEPRWNLETAALLLPIGRLALPPELQARLQAGSALTPPERALLDRLPETGAQLLVSIPRLRDVSQIIRYQAKGYDGTGSPADGVAGETIPLGARILRVALDFTLLERQRRSRKVALEEMALRSARYDPRVLRALYAQFGTPAAAQGAERPCAVADLQEGMVLARSVLTSGGRTVLAAGLKLGGAHLVLLREAAELLDLQEPVLVVNE